MRRLSQLLILTIVVIILFRRKDASSLVSDTGSGNGTFRKNLKHHESQFSDVN